MVCELSQVTRKYVYCHFFLVVMWFWFSRSKATKVHEGFTFWFLKLGSQEQVLQKALATGLGIEVLG